MPPYTGGANVDKYELNCIRDDESDSAEPELVYTGEELECTVTGLLPGTKYDFSLRGSNRAGVSNICYAVVGNINTSNFMERKAFHVCKVAFVNNYISIYMVATS